MSEKAIVKKDYSLAEIEKIGTYVAKSGLFGVSRPEQAVALLLLAQAEGLHPMEAVKKYHIVQGRPVMKAETMQAEFQRAGGKIIWKQLDDKIAEAEFIAPDGSKATIKWTIDMAKKIGLTSKDNWKNYPRAMLRARCISEGIRTVYPQVVLGVYTPEEVLDFDTASVNFEEPVINEDGSIEPEIAEPEIPEEPKVEFITDRQLKALHAIANKKNVDIKQVIADKYRLTSAKDLTKEQASELIDELQKQEEPDTAGVPF